MPPQIKQQRNRFKHAETATILKWLCEYKNLSEFKRTRKVGESLARQLPDFSEHQLVQKVEAVLKKHAAMRRHEKCSAPLSDEVFEKLNQVVGKWERRSRQPSKTIKLKLNLNAPKPSKKASSPKKVVRVGAPKTRRQHVETASKSYGERCLDSLIGGLDGMLAELGRDWPKFTQELKRVRRSACSIGQDKNKIDDVEVGLMRLYCLLEDSQ